MAFLQSARIVARPGFRRVNLIRVFNSTYRVSRRRAAPATQTGEPPRGWYRLKGSGASPTYDKPYTHVADAERHLHACADRAGVCSSRCLPGLGRPMSRSATSSIVWRPTVRCGSSGSLIRFPFSSKPRSGSMPQRGSDLTVSIGGCGYSSRVDRRNGCLPQTRPTSRASAVRRSLGASGATRPCGMIKSRTDQRGRPRKAHRP